MGRELSRRGVHDNTGLWSAQALLDAPEIVLQVHKDFIAAGAKIITSNSYSTIPSYLGKRDLAQSYVELTRLAGQLARRAVQESPEEEQCKENVHKVEVRVAGSLPPLSESFRPDLVPSGRDVATIYESMVKALEPYVDLFLCETMSSGAEALHAAAAAKKYGHGKPVYVAWTLDERPGKGLRSGEPIAQALALIAPIEIDAYLFNCTSPEAILQALKELAALTDKPIGGYPNRFNNVDPQWTLYNDVKTSLRDDIDIAFFVQMAQQFEAAGATIIGGCCGIGPEYIEALAQAQVQAQAQAHAQALI
jgi:S-methylmethionine-dependent homocysteine/selenocysteine methylase